MDIEMKIQNENTAEFLVGFLKCNPVPLIEDPPTVFTPAMTDHDWVTEWCKNQLTYAYRTGKSKIAKETADFNGQLFTS